MVHFFEKKRKVKTMKPIHFLHTADMHLGAKLPALRSRGEERMSEKIQTLKRILTSARSREISLVLIAGDFLEASEITPSLLREIRHILAEYPEIQIFISPGNHDPYTVDSAYAMPGWPENVYIFSGGLERIDLPEFSLSIYGAGFQETYQRTSFLCDFEKVKHEAEPGWTQIALLHGQLVSSGQESLYNPMDPAQFPGELTYVALGHIHQACQKINAYGTSYAYSGCPEGGGFDETGEKGILEGIIDDTGLHLSFLPTATRLFFREHIDLSDIETTEEAVQRIRETLGNTDFSKNYYRLILTGRTSWRDISLLERELEETMYFLSLRDELLPWQDPYALAQEESLKGYFVQNLLRMQEKADPELQKQIELAMRYGLDAFEGKENLLGNTAFDPGKIR